jgi:hypothetical protein
MRTASDGTIIHRPDERFVSLKTYKGFGCVHFEEKPQGPFSIRETMDAAFHPIYEILFNSKCGYTRFVHKYEALLLCDWLNDLWMQREVSRWCGNCGTYVHCAKQGRVCDEWGMRR